MQYLHLLITDLEFVWPPAAQISAGNVFPVLTNLPWEFLVWRLRGS
ncbi:MAG: hypothetical protein M1541_00890 [Acidobacteria bacterium]|nr:hypothetical protein [Acidobacteriota bacterium]